MKILAAVDGSAYTKRMLAYLATHEQWLSADNDYTVLHCVAGVPARAAAVLDKATLQGYYNDEAEKVFKPLRVFFRRHAIEPRFVAQVGHAGEVIAKTAEKGRYDLVILGSHGHGAFANLVLGSTSSKVIAQCGVPVLLIR
jgi:nucleotide-binding universal stress UspA family protein